MGSRFAPRSRHWGLREAGAASTEYIGGIVVAGVIVALISATVLQAPLIPVSVRYGICRMLHVLGGGDCEKAPDASSPTDADFKPAQCKIREDSEKAGSKVTLGWFTIGKEYGFIEQHFSDGTVRLTMVDSASIGAVASGKEKLFDIGKLGENGKGGASVEIAAGLKFGYGDTWQFKDDAEMKKFRAEIEKYEVQQMTYQSEGGGAVAIWDAIFGNTADPPDPTITFGKLNVEASLKGALGIKVPTGPAPSPGKNPPVADPNIGGSLTLKGDYEVTVEHNKTAGTTSYTYQLSGTGTVAGNAVSVGGELGGKTSGAFKVTRNDKGELVSISFISTRETSEQINANGKTPTDIGSVKAGGKVKAGSTYTQASVTSTTLNLTTPEDQAIAQNWLSGNNEQWSSPFNLTHSVLIPDRPPTDGDPFAALLYQKAKVSDLSYNNVTDLKSFGAQVNMGFKLGFEVSMEDATSQIADAHYLGAPDQTGTRVMVDYAECS